MSKKDTGGEVVLSEELVASYLAAREKDIGTSKLFYFEHIMPRFRKPLEEIEEHKRVAAREFETLVSLMGFSPETTVQACIVVRPKKLVVIGSDGDNARAAAKPAFEYLQREGLIDPFNDLTQIRVDAFDPESIYKSLQENIRGLKNVLLDITGGTKVMSFTAGAFAWEEKLPVCYLNGGWDPQRGAAGLAKV
ncbi:MAG: hypothetical protein IT367_12375, partial [Candidatus Hydrogenedentes bacterium]|nr:hypothetical protein [Candidatus Hydrogenedentota bacterium]